MEPLSDDMIYKYDEAYHDKLLKDRPWIKDDTYFKKVMLSTLATMKVVDHAIKGGSKEICGYLVGFAREGTFYVLDAVEIPIIGTDSRVEIAGQMGDKAHVYTMQYLDLMEKVGRQHQYIGWYHSHPGFGVWLSGVDVNTQKLMQMVNKTFFALVVDPYRTLANKKVEIGCFMCFNEDNKNGNKSKISESIPLYKVEDFGVHASKYYKLDHSYFQTKFESQIARLIYKNYWVETLSNNSIISNNTYYMNQVEDMTAKIKSYNIEKCAHNINTQEQNELLQKKLDDVAKLNSQTNVYIQNELLKTVIFKDN